jgi:hypothetical protein
MRRTGRALNCRARAESPCSYDSKSERITKSREGGTDGHARIVNPAARRLLDLRAGRAPGSYSAWLAGIAPVHPAEGGLRMEIALPLAETPTPATARH